MPFLLALLAIAGGVIFWMTRARNAANVATDLVDMANDVRLAARRFGFRRQANVHAVDSVDDTNVLTTALASAFIELDDLPTSDQRDALNVALRSTLRLSQDDTDEMLILGRWLVAECGGAQPAVARIARRIYRQQGAAAIEPLTSILNDSMTRAGRTLSPKQADALADVRHAFRLK